MRIVRINPLPNLSPRQREMAIQQGWWPGEEEAAGFRVYETADGDAVIAPWNPAIRPGMKVVAEGSIQRRIHSSGGGALRGREDSRGSC